MLFSVWGEIVKTRLLNFSEGKKKKRTVINFFSQFGSSNVVYFYPNKDIKNNDSTFETPCVHLKNKFAYFQLKFHK